MSNTAIPKNLLSFVWKYFSSHDSDTIVLRKSLIKICSGSHTSALLLSQLIYWHNKYHDMERWMKITYDEWYDQILLTKRQISYSREKLESLGLIETKLQKFNNAPSLHYRVNFEKLYQILINLENEPGKSQNVTMESNNMSLSESDKMSQPITEITTENTSEKYNKGFVQNKSKPKNGLVQTTTQRYCSVSVFSDVCSIKSFIEKVVANRKAYVEDDIINQCIFYIGKERNFDAVNHKINIWHKKVREGKWNIPNGYQGITYQSIKDQEQQYDSQKQQQHQKDAQTFRDIKKQISLKEMLGWGKVNHG